MYLGGDAIARHGLRFACWYFRTLSALECGMLDMFKRPGDPPEQNYLYVIPAAALLAIYAFGYYLNVPAIA